MASSTSATWRRYFFLLVHIGYGRNGREAGGMKKRRQWTTYSGSGKRVAPRTRTSRVSRGKEMGVPRLWVQLIVCGALVVALIGLKLLMPGNLSALRGTLGQWLVRDADFISAFSAVAALAGVLCSLALLGGVVYLYVQTRGGALVIFAALALLLSALKELRLARRAIKV